MIAPENLAIALKKAKRGKLDKPSVQRVLANPDKYLSELQELLASGNYRTSLYHNKYIYEPNLRLIYALPFFPDRIAQHALMNILEPVWDSRMHSHSFSCRRNFGQHKASYLCRDYVRKYRYCSQLDISQFYVNLDHELLKECYRHKIKDASVLSMLDELVDSIDVRQRNIELYRDIITNEQARVGLAKLQFAIELNDYRPAGVAVGSLVSQWFGNLFLTDMDFAFDMPYIRFCDDILLFANEKAELRDATAKYEELLKRKRLHLSKARTFPTSQGVDFCGYKAFSNGVVLVRKSTARRKKREFKALEANLSHTAKETALGVIASASGLLKHANAYHLRRTLRLDELKERVLSL